MSFTTVFSTHCWRKLSTLGASGALALALAHPVLAQGITARSADLEQRDDSYALNADFDVSLTPALEDALTRGVALYFLVELDIWRERNWWFDKSVVSNKLTRKLSYSALTRQYRLTSGSLYQNFFYLEEALRNLGRVRGSLGFERKLLRKQRAHQAEVRMSLDVSQLPSLFQLDALASPDWKLNIVSYSWTFTPE